MRNGADALKDISCGSKSSSGSKKFVFPGASAEALPSAKYSAAGTSSLNPTSSSSLTGSMVQQLDDDATADLHHVCMKGDASRASSLLEAQANANAIDTQGHSPLHLSCNNGHLECVKLLLNAGANVSSEDIFQKDTPLHKACWYGYADIARLLLDASADPSAVNKYGKTPKDKAARYGHVRCLESLDDVACLSARTRQAKWEKMPIGRDSGYFPSQSVLNSFAPLTSSGCLSAAAVSSATSEDFFMEPDIEDMATVEDWALKALLWTTAGSPSRRVDDLLNSPLSQSHAGTGVNQAYSSLPMPKVAGP